MGSPMIGRKKDQIVALSYFLIEEAEKFPEVTVETQVGVLYFNGIRSKCVTNIIR